jgi:hypothetical protein
MALVSGVAGVPGAGVALGALGVVALGFALGELMAPAEVFVASARAQDCKGHYGHKRCTSHV